MSYLKTLLVNGTDLRTMTGARVLAMDLYAPGVVRGDVITVPGRQGALGVALVRDVYAFSVSIMLDGADEATWTANLANIASTIAPVAAGGLCSLERRLPASGASPYMSSYANGQFTGGLSPTMFPGLISGRTELQFVNLSGGWTTDVADVDDPTAGTWMDY